MTNKNTYTQDERLMATLAHGSIVTGQIGIIAAVAIYLTQKDKSRYIAKQAAQAALYQLVGLLGIIIGFGQGAAVAVVMDRMWDVSWLPSVPMTWIAAVMLTSLGLGLVFGVYPAWRAGRLDPIVALRYE